MIFWIYLSVLKFKDIYLKCFLLKRLKDLTTSVLITKKLKNEINILINRSCTHKHSCRFQHRYYVSCDSYVLKT